MATQNFHPTGIAPELAEAAVRQQATSSMPADGIQPCPLLTWIEIHLLDMEGNPMPGRQYLIETPTGSELRGVLDDEGKARVEGLPRGTCKVCFPEFDTECWERV